MQLKLADVDFSLPQPSLTFPARVGFYSVDNERKCKDDFSSLKYFKEPPPPPLNFNLNVGLETFVDSSNRNEHIDHLLQYILRHFLKLRSTTGREKILHADIVCFRGVITKIMVTPYEKHNWTICAMNYKGTTYLCEFDKIDKDFPNKHKFAYWGHKFESYVLANSPNKSPDWKKPININEEFCILFSSKIDGTRLLYGAEVDGVHSDVELNINSFYNKSTKFVELKTNRIINNAYQDTNWRKKIVKWWCQSFLVGIENIHVGFRTNNGIVKEFEEIKNISKLCKGIWDGRNCLIFLNQFFKFLKNITNDSNDIWKFQYVSDNDEIIASKVGVEYDFLPNWYTEELLRMSKLYR